MENDDYNFIKNKLFDFLNDRLKILEDKTFNDLKEIELMKYETYFLNNQGI